MVVFVKLMAIPQMANYDGHRAASEAGRPCRSIVEEKGKNRPRMYAEAIQEDHSEGGLKNIRADLRETLPGACFRPLPVR